MVRYPIYSIVGLSAVLFLNCAGVVANEAVLTETDNAIVASVPLGATAGDLNGDAIEDVAVAHSTGLVSVLFSNGDSTFASLTELPVGFDVRQTRIADLDGDGDQEIIALLRNADFALVVWRNDGTGTFSPPQFFGGPIATSFALELTDVNDDGILDVVLVEGFVDSRLSMYAGDGAGGFALHGHHEFDDQVDFSYIFDVASGDLNGDGRQDMIASSLFASFLFIMHGEPGGFADPIPVAIDSCDFHDSAGVGAVEIGDADGDGDLDVFFLQQCNNDTDALGIVRNDGGTFAVLHNVVGIEVSHSFTKPFALTIADVNSDGLVDVVTTSPREDLAPVILNEGGLSFVVADQLPTAREPVVATTANIDDDSDADVIVLTLENLSVNGRVHVFRNESTFNPADIDEDGVVDLFDLLELLANWGTNGPGAALAEPTDTVDLLDLLEVLASWGACRP